jgi:hypothetical protein
MCGGGRRQPYVDRSLQSVESRLAVLHAAMRRSLDARRRTDELPPGRVATAGNNGWSLYGAQRLQPVATGGKCECAGNGSDNRKPFAVGCDRLPEAFHGKEGVDGSSPSEDFAVQPAISAFLLSALTLI